MPPNTVVPIDWRLAAPAPAANISGTTPRMKAKAVIRIGRSRKPPRLHRRLDDAEPLLAAALGEFDDQNGVLRRQADQHDEADLRIDVDLHVRAQSASTAPNRASGTASRTMNGIVQLSYCAARIRKTKTIASAKIERGDRAGLELLEGDAGPFVAEIARQRRRRRALHRRHRLAGADSPAPRRH